MLSKELEITLNTVFVEAREQRHEYVTVEHLLLALLDNPHAVSVLQGCGARVDELRTDLLTHISATTPIISNNSEDHETQPSLGFQRVLQRAIFHVQSAGQSEVNGANVLVAIFNEQDSKAVSLLRDQKITRLDVVNFIAHGIGRIKHSEFPGQINMPSFEEEVSPEALPNNILEAYTINLNARALAGNVDPLIGRADELERMIQTLCRRRKIIHYWWAKQGSEKQHWLKA